MTHRPISAEVSANRTFSRDLAIFGAVFAVVTTAAYAATLSWSGPVPRDTTGLILGRDFLNFWMYGRAATSDVPGLFYDQQIYNRVLLEMLGFDYSGQNWSYPPSIMLLAAPFGQLGYLPALLIWTLISLAILIPVMRSELSDRRVLLALLLSPAAMFCLTSGQSSFITAAMLVGIFSWLDRRPVVAGFLIGCLTLKPQLGLLFPIMLAVSGHWRVFTSAAVTTIALAGVTALLFGPQVWVDFIVKGLPVQNEILADPQLVATPFYPTIFMNMRGVGASYTIAMVVQLCFSMAAAVAVIWAFRFRKNADPQSLFALFLACSVCASPYLLSYDLLPLTVAALALLDRGKLDVPGRRMVQLVYWLPVLQLAFGAVHIPGPALIPAAFALYVLFRLGALSPMMTSVAPWVGIKRRSAS